MLHQTVLISNYQKYFKLVEFFSQHTKKRMGIIMGANTLSMVFDEKYYRNLNGGILEAFGILFSRDQNVPLPMDGSAHGRTVEGRQHPLHPRMQPLFDYLRFNKRIIDIPYDEDVLGIFSKEALELIKTGKDGWESMVPDFVDRIIKKNRLFGYSGAPLRRNPKTKRTQRRQPPEPFHPASNKLSLTPRKKPVSRRAFRMQMQ